MATLSAGGGLNYNKSFKPACWSCYVLGLGRDESCFPYRRKSRAQKCSPLNNIIQTAKEPFFERQVQDMI